MQLRTIPLLAFALLAAGCASQPPPRSVVAKQEAIPIESQANVRTGEVVKAYPINRYRDPANSRILHERHVVYRVESDADWRLSSNAKQQILVGNTLTQSPMNASETARTADAAAAAIATVRLTKECNATEQAIVVMSGQLAAMKKDLSKKSDSAAANAGREEMAKLAEAITTLQKSQAEVTKQIEVLSKKISDYKPRSPASTTPTSVGVTPEEAKRAQDALNVSPAK